MGMSLPEASLVFAMLNAHSVVAMDNQSWSSGAYQLCFVREKVKEGFTYGCARHVAAWTHPAPRDEVSRSITWLGTCLLPIPNV
jgi:hypothetical protein